MNRIISVSLILLDGENKGKIALQRRNLENKSFQYVYQGTWEGKCEAGENDMAAVKRECAEELGQIFFEAFNFSELKLISEDEFILDSEKWACSHYLGSCSSNLLCRAKLHKEAFPEFIFVDKNSLIYPLDSKLDPKDNIVLFNDQYKVLKNILNGN